jgi:hypothetical protein
MKPKSCNIQRLIYYDYFLIHAFDLDIQYSSIHPDNPYRSGEIAIKRELLFNGLKLLCKKKLVEVEFSKNGIYYIASDLANQFLIYFKSPYFLKLEKMSYYIIQFFDSYSDSKLTTFVDSKIRGWGTEFVKESIMRGDLDD